MKFEIYCKNCKAQIFYLEELISAVDITALRLLPKESWMRGEQARDALGRWNSRAASDIQQIKQIVQEKVEQGAQVASKVKTEIDKTIEESLAQADREFAALTGIEREEILSNLSKAYQQIHADMSDRAVGSAVAVKAFAAEKGIDLDKMAKPFQQTWDKYKGHVKAVQKFTKEHERAIGIGLMAASAIPLGLMILAPATLGTGAALVGTGIGIDLASFAFDSLVFGLPNALLTQIGFRAGANVAAAGSRLLLAPKVGREVNRFVTANIAKASGEAGKGVTKEGGGFWGLLGFKNATKAAKSLIDEDPAQAKQILQEYDIDFDKLLKRTAKEEEKVISRSRNEIKKEIIEIESSLQQINSYATQQVTKMQRGEASELSHNDIFDLVALMQKNQKKAAKLARELDVIDGYGFSTKKRANELIKLHQNPKADPLKKEWRQGVIQSSLKYGDLLDELEQLELESNKEITKIHKKLIKSLEKNPGHKGNFEIAPEKDIAKIREQMIDRSMTVPSQSTIDGINKMALEDLTELQKILPNKLSVDIGFVRQHPFAVGGSSSGSGRLTNFLNKESFGNARAFTEKDGFINIGDTTTPAYGYGLGVTPRDNVRSATWHEGGHLFEMKENLIDKSATFIKDREADHLRNPNKRYGKIPVPGDRQVHDGRFYHDYFGKIYEFEGINLSTEIVSSGIESISNPQALHTVSTIDRETILYTLSILK